MASQDAIAIALGAPIAWEKFEQLACELLTADDLPRLRRIGGQADKGVDAAEETFYRAERADPTIIQITSQRAQVDKLKDTLHKLSNNKIPVKHLILVLRHPVASPVRTELLAEAQRASVSLDIRDQQYLITQLAKPGSTIFARHFEPLALQIKSLLETADPLQLAQGRLRHALLASLAAFTLAPRARLARSALFEKTVLAAVVATGRPVEARELVPQVGHLLPSEEIDADRVTTALDTLSQRKECVARDGKFTASEATLVSIGATIRTTTDGYNALVKSIIDYCERGSRVDDATKGYIERNVRRALLALFRMHGPVDPESGSLHLDSQRGDDLLLVIAADLPEATARACLVALTSFVENPENRRIIAPLLRAYAALAIRNLDPVGRKWQEATLSRSVLALDTDATLKLLIEELPEHRPIKRALMALAASGVRIIIAQHVLDEVVMHVQRAEHTFKRFRSSLLRMPHEAIDAEVWHAVVRGYYYARAEGQSLGFDTYWNNYYDRSRAEEYIRFLLSRRVECEVRTLDSIQQDWQADLESLVSVLLERTERQRLKAPFRDLEDMRRRVTKDVRMALHLAEYPTSSADGASRGYLISEDHGFERMQRDSAWRGREKVLISTRLLPELANFVCGSVLTDDEIVTVLFDPVFTVAAEQLRDQIDELARLGVNLMNVPLDKLEWDLRQELRDKIHDFRLTYGDDSGATVEEGVRAAVAVVQAADAAGYSVAEPIAEAVRRYQQARDDALRERGRRLETEKKLREFAGAARDTTKRGRRRINRILRELGIELEEPEED